MSHVCEADCFHFPKWCRVLMTFLSVISQKNNPALPIHFSGQTIYCCLLDPLNLNDPCDSLKETLCWNGALCFTCHVLMTDDIFSGTPKENLELIRNGFAKIFLPHLKQIQVHFYTSQYFTLECICMVPVIKTTIVALSTASLTSATSDKEGWQGSNHRS